MEYLIRRLNIEDFDDVFHLYQTVFNGDLTKKDLLNKYSTGFTGHDMICFGAFFKQELVSFYGSIPHYILKNDEKLLVAQSSDAMTSNNHLRKGLFLKLANQNFDFCKGIGVNLVYGFPNQHSKPGFVKKMNWVFTNDLCVRIFNVRCLPFLFMKRKLGFLIPVVKLYQELLIKLNKTKPKEYKSLISSDGSLGVLKDQLYIQYKLQNSNSFFMKIYGKFVWMKITDMFLLVGDIEDCEIETFSKIIKRIKQFCFLIGVPHIRFHLSENSEIIGFLDNMICPDEKSYAVGGLVFNDGLSLNDLKFTMADNDTF